MAINIQWCLSARLFTAAETFQLACACLSAVRIRLQRGSASTFIAPIYCNEAVWHAIPNLVAPYHRPQTFRCCWYHFHLFYLGTKQRASTMDAFLSAGNGVNFTSSTSIEVMYFPVHICKLFLLAQCRQQLHSMSL